MTIGASIKNHVLSSVASTDGWSLWRSARDHEGIRVALADGIASVEGRVDGHHGLDAGVGQGQGDKVKLDPADVSAGAGDCVVDQGVVGGGARSGGLSKVGVVVGTRSTRGRQLDNATNSEAIGTGGPSSSSPGCAGG